jgi:hypothetical protein
MALDKNLIVIVIVFVILTGVVAFFSGQYIGSHKQSNRQDTVIVRTTTIVPVPVIKIDTLPAVITMKRELAISQEEAWYWKNQFENYQQDTVRDSLSYQLPVAEKDTVIQQHNDSIHVAYHFPPKNFFSLSIKPGKLSIKHDSIFVTKGYELPVSVWQPVKYVSIGIGATALLYLILHH